MTGTPGWLDRISELQRKMDDPTTEEVYEFEGILRNYSYDLIRMAKEHQFGMQMFQGRPDIWNLKMRKLRNALKAVLLFHRDGQWNFEDDEEWQEITGTSEVTTKNLCDTIRDVLSNP